MLTEIRCKSFAESHRSIRFRPGLNTVLGSNGGSNAIGKSTFLWIVDYALGGEKYQSIGKDNLQNVPSAPVYFTFQFDNVPYYFYRTLEEPKNVCQCDINGHQIKKLNLEEYRRWLAEAYNVACPGLSWQDITGRFHRIYGADNIYEKTPYLIKPRESDERAADFILRLSGENEILRAISSAEERLGVKYSQFSESSTKPVDLSKIAINEKTIESLQKRLDALTMQLQHDQLSFIGFNTDTFDKIQRLQRDIRSLVRTRNRLKAQLNAVTDTKAFAASHTEAEFGELTHFFPGIELKPFDEIERFHQKLHAILSAEAQEEIDGLSTSIAKVDEEISRLKEHVKNSGIVDELSSARVSQCVSISKKLDALKDENEELLRQKELQETRKAAESEMRILIDQLHACITTTADTINRQLALANQAVTEGHEKPPVLKMFEDKALRFGTPENTSEGTAYKSMVVYDLALASLYPIPVLIHDSNILKRIDDTYLEHILECYQGIGKQVFIAFDKADSATEKAKQLLLDTRVLELNDGNELYGKSWTKK